MEARIKTKDTKLTEDSSESLDDDASARRKKKAAKHETEI